MSAELTKTEQIALSSLKAESQRLQAMNLQFNAAVQAVSLEIESAHPGYSLDHSTLTLVPKLVVEVPVVEDNVVEMPAVAGIETVQHESEVHSKELI